MMATTGEGTTTIVDERMEVLRMVQRQQITAEDGARLLAALDAKDLKDAPAQQLAKTGMPRWFKVVVDEPGRQRVNVTVPLHVVEPVLKFAVRFVPEQHREAVMGATDLITSGLRGDIVRVEDPGGQNVRVWIE